MGGGTVGVEVSMLTSLADLPSIHTRARRILAAAAALSAAVMSPVACELLLGNLAFAGRMTPSDLLLGGWGALLGALLAAGVMTRALHGPSAPTAGRVVGWALVGGLSYPLLLLAPRGLAGLVQSSASEALRLVVLAPVVLTLLGAIVSLPTGAVFGAVFWSGVARARARLAQPAHDTVAHAWTSGAVTLLVAAAVVLGPVALLEGSYCQALFFVILPALGVVPPEGADLAWTRFLVVPAPLLAGAALFAWRGTWHARRVARTVEALHAGTHPRWALEARGRGAEAHTLPLVGDHHLSVERAVVVTRDDGSPYRDGAGALAWIARTVPDDQPPLDPPSEIATGPT